MVRMSSSFIQRGKNLQVTYDYTACYVLGAVKKKQLYHSLTLSTDEGQRSLRNFNSATNSPHIIVFTLISCMRPIILPSMRQ